MGAQIGLRTNARDPGGHVEERMRDLAGRHVHFVVERHGDQHVGLLRAGQLQRIGMRAMADIAAHVERVADAANELRRGVDERNVVASPEPSFSRCRTDLSRPQIITRMQSDSRFVRNVAGG